MPAQEVSVQSADFWQPEVDVYKRQLHELAKYLYEKETITGEEFMQILTRTETLEEAEGLSLIHISGSCDGFVSRYCFILFICWRMA